MMKFLIPIAALALTLSACSEADPQPTSLSSDLKDELRHDASAETISDLASYLDKHEDAQVDDADLAPLAELLNANMQQVRATISDNGGARSLDVEPGSMLRVVSELQRDEALRTEVLDTVSAATVDEAAAATKRYVAGRRNDSTEAALDSSLHDTALATGALATALGVDGYEAEATVEDVAARVASGSGEVQVTPGRELILRSIIAATYLNSPPELLSPGLKKRPPLEEPDTIEQVYEWLDTDSPPIGSAYLRAISEDLEGPWFDGGELVPRNP
ncbi:hypothetical protein [Nocardioides sp. NPDC127503]|uniref:hypothetical protein n=1 Tax=Nocardioides sp. NPDC127503 TaxID=3154516 RepID=UPI00331C48C2